MRTLCFDDGPTGLTETVLDILAGRQSIFAIVGERARERPDVVQRIVREGHTLANHTMTHARLTELNLDGIIDEIEDCADTLEEIVGFRPTLLRPPYAACNGLVEEIADLYDYELLRASSMGDYLFENPDEIAYAARSHPSFLGLHDTHAPTVAALPAILAAA